MIADVDGGREPVAVDVEGDVEVLDLEDRAVVLGDDRLAGSWDEPGLESLTSCLSVLPRSCGGASVRVAPWDRPCDSGRAARAVLGGCDGGHRRGRLCRRRASTGSTSLLRVRRTRCSCSACWAGRPSGDPYVEVSDGGVTVVATPCAPWRCRGPPSSEVDGRYGLRLRTAYGAVTAWAAQRSQRADSARRGQDSVAAPAW